MMESMMDKLDARFNTIGQKLDKGEKDQSRLDK